MVILDGLAGKCVGDPKCLYNFFYFHIYIYIYILITSIFMQIVITTTMDYVYKQRKRVVKPCGQERIALAQTLKGLCVQGDIIGKTSVILP